jgi:N utilization substance protein A
MMFEEYQDRVGELITGIIQQSDNRYTLVQLRERVEALLPRSEQVWNERYDHGMRVKAVITEVNAEGKGPGIVVSRRNSELIKQLFELEVPEIADSLVEIVGVAREPGYRSKIAVISHADGVDPVGACVGPRGSRVRMVVSELRGEKIDIIPYNEEPARFVAKALSPARVREVLVDDEKQEATVIVPDDQLSLAIGREGQNARLAAKLTGWKVDIKSETEFSQEEDELTYEEGEEADGRCAAVLSAGRRCPNAALPGSRYCGLPQHQALRRFETNQVTVLTPLTDQEIQKLADSAAPEGEIAPLVERATAEFDQAQAKADAEAAKQAEEQAEDGAEAEEEASEQAGTEAQDEEEAEEEETEAQDEEEAEEEETEALAQDAATEGPEDAEPAEEAPAEATAPVGAPASEESEAEGEDSEELGSEES